MRYFIIVVLLSGCAGAPKPLKPGSAKQTHRVLTATAPVVATEETKELVQPENPGEASSQQTERTVRTTLALPAGTRIASPATAEAPAQTFVLAAPALQAMEVIERSGTVLGAAQKDESRPLAARLASLRPVQYAGMLFIGLAAFLAWHGWWTKAALAGGTGLGMIVLAAILPGREGWILGGGAAVVLLGSLLVLYAYHKGLLDKATSNSETK